MPDDPAALTASINLGNPLVLESPHSKTARAIKRLAAAVTRQSFEVDEEPTWRIVALAKTAARLIANRRVGQNGRQVDREFSAKRESYTATSRSADRGEHPCLI